MPYVAQRIPVEEQLFRERKISTEVYNAFDTLSQRWYYADTEEAREEISALAQKIRDNGYKITDCSEQANQELWKNGQDIYNLSLYYSRVTMGYLWYTYVKNNGEWDYKVHLKETDKKKVDWMPAEGYFLYYGNIISAADFGNINYGYTGTLLGLTPETLYKAGGMVAPNPSKYEKDNYYSDSEIDHYWIKKGIEQANNQGYYGQTNLPVETILDIVGG